jgi:pyruvate formate lyase activating enzyme
MRRQLKDRKKGAQGNDNLCQMGLISNVQRFSIHDGPGIRDLIFMKGCPLRCKWCSNPESQNHYPEIAYNLNRCIGKAECGKCLKVCEVGAIVEHSTGKVNINRNLCTQCGKCAQVCPAEALQLFGKPISTDDLLTLIEEDHPFYSRSAGGVTISGGDPLSQPEFVQDLLKKCQGHGIDTAIETAGHGSWEDIEKVCRYANLIIFDLKCLDPQKHRAFTGVTNELILANIRKISTHFPQTPLIVRTAIIPGFNDSEEYIGRIVEFIARLKNLKEYEILPYHGFGEPKYALLGEKYPLTGCQAISREQMIRLQRISQKSLGLR